MNINSTLTQAYLQQRLNYNLVTGVFTWKPSPNKRSQVEIGGAAGSIDSRGYILIVIDSKSYPAHRLAHLYVTGEFPSGQVDHDNRIKSDNKWGNIKRIVTHKENSKNSTLRSDNTSGVNGVCWVEKRQKWWARVKVDGKYKHLGYFTLKRTAIEVRKAADKLYGYHEGHGSPVLQT